MKSLKSIFLLAGLFCSVVAPTWGMVEGRGENALTEAVKSGNIEEVMVALKTASVDDVKGYYVIEAIEKGRGEVIEKLLEAGMSANLSKVLFFGGKESLLEAALNKGQEDIATLLLQHGAKGEKPKLFKIAVEKKYFKLQNALAEGLDDDAVFNLYGDANKVWPYNNMRNFPRENYSKKLAETIFGPEPSPELLEYHRKAAAERRKTQSEIQKNANEVKQYFKKTYGDNFENRFKAIAKHMTDEQRKRLNLYDFPYFMPDAYVRSGATPVGYRGGDDEYYDELAGYTSYHDEAMRRNIEALVKEIEGIDVITPHWSPEQMDELFKSLEKSEAGQGARVLGYNRLFNSLSCASTHASSASSHAIGEELLQAAGLVIETFPAQYELKLHGTSDEREKQLHTFEQAIRMCVKILENEFFPVLKKLPAGTQDPKLTKTFEELLEDYEAYDDLTSRVQWFHDYDSHISEAIEAAGVTPPGLPAGEVEKPTVKDKAGIPTSHLVYGGLAIAGAILIPAILWKIYKKRKEEKEKLEAQLLEEIDEELTESDAEPVI